MHCNILSVLHNYILSNIYNIVLINIKNLTNSNFVTSKSILIFCLTVQKNYYYKDSKNLISPSNWKFVDHYIIQKSIGIQILFELREILSVKLDFNNNFLIFF